MAVRRHLTKSKKWILFCASLVGKFSFIFSINACLVFRSELKISFTVVLNELSVCDSLIYPCSCSVCVFSKWHGLQRTCKFSGSLPPPLASGIMWSTWNLFLISFLHDWHSPFALSNSFSRSSFVGWTRATLTSRNRFFSSLIRLLKDWFLNYNSALLHNWRTSL